MRARLLHRLRGEAGFTLVEVCVAMGLSVIVLFGILNTFDSFSRNASRQTKITSANENVRVAMDRIVSDLRQADTLEVADPNDLVYTVKDGATAYRRERICLDTSGYIWRSSVTTTSPPSSTIGSGTSCPNQSTDPFKIASLVSANGAANPLFRYNAASVADVSIVGLTFALDAGNVGRNDVSTLRAGAFVRAKSETAIANLDGDDIATICSSSGVPTLTLSAGAGPLTVSYTDIDGNSLGSSAAGEAVVMPTGTTTVVANVTSSSGTLTQLLKTIAC